MRITLRAGILACVVAFGAPASATIINFDSIGVVNNVFPYYTHAGFADQGFYFSTNTDVIDIGPGAPWDQPPTLSGRFAALNDYGGSIVMTKVGGGTFSLDSFFIKGWYGSVGGQTVTGYSSNVSVGSINYNLLSSGWNHVVTNFGNVDTVSFNTPNNAVLLDDVSVNATVPEPATWALMIVGFGLVGVSVRRRNTAIAA